jgi:acetoin utilization deacetylase AcuC-like enzyme
MPKFGKLYERLLIDRIATLDQFHTPEIPPTQWIELVHTPDYVQAYYQGTLDPKAQRRIGLPWSSALVKRTCTAVGGTLLTAQLALKYGLACNTAGGTHHAFPSYGSGFCIFNDLAIAARVLQQQGLAQKFSSSTLMSTKETAPPSFSKMTQPSSPFPCTVKSTSPVPNKSVT